MAGTSECTTMSNGDASLGQDIRRDVQEYYGKTLNQSNDLQTNACKVGKAKIPPHVREALALISPEVSSKYYGCGLIAPPALEGASILDLGCGAGQDVFVMAKLAGPSGHVTGLDMTDEQLAVANRNIEYHMTAFGHPAPNVTFVKGFMETLGDAGLKEDTFDVIASNCVVCLSPDKRAVLSEACRVLKVGGEICFSDIYSDRDIPEELRKHKVLWGEGLAGCLYWQRLSSLVAELGFSRPRLVSARTLTVDNPEHRKLVGDVRYVAATYRFFKLPTELADPQEVTYTGGILGEENELAIDLRTRFKSGEPVSVDAETATILSCSRFSRHFTFKPTSGSTSATRGADAQTPVDPFVAASETGCPSG